MVGCSEFTRRNYLKSCAEAGMIETPIISTYQPSASARFSSTTLGTPLGITHRAYRNAGILPKSFSRNTTRLGGSGNSYLPLSSNPDPPQEDSNGISNGNGTLPANDETLLSSSYATRFPRRTKDSNGVSNANAAMPANDEPLLSSSYATRFPRRTNVRREDKQVVMTNPFKLETDSMEAYIRSRRPIIHVTTEKIDTNGASVAPRPVETTLQDTRPTYSIRNMPLRNLDELRETIAIRRNYSKDRALGNTYSYGLEIPTPPDSTASLLLYSSSKSEEPERSRSRLSTSPYVSRSQSRLASEEKSTQLNSDDKSIDSIEKPTE